MIKKQLIFKILFFIVIILRFNAHSATIRCLNLFSDIPKPDQVLVRDEESGAYRLATIFRTLQPPGRSDSRERLLGVRYSDGTIDTDVGSDRTFQILATSQIRDTIVNLDLTNKTFALSTGEIIGERESSSVNHWGREMEYAIRLKSGEIYVFKESQIFQHRNTSDQVVVSNSPLVFAGVAGRSKQLTLGKVIGEKIISNIDTYKNLIVVELKNGQLQVIRHAELFDLKSHLTGRRAKILYSGKMTNDQDGIIIGIRRYSGEPLEYAIQLINGQIVLKKFQEIQILD